MPTPYFSKYPRTGQFGEDSMVNLYRKINLPPQPQPVLNPPDYAPLGSTAGIQTVFTGNLSPIIPNWVNASDPHVIKLDNQWTMFFTAIALQGPDTGQLHILKAVLPEGAPLTSNDWELVPGAQLAPGADGWNTSAVETSHYVTNDVAERIYFTGWTGEVYGIGASELKYGLWEQQPEPIIVPEHPDETHPSLTVIGDPSVTYLDGVWTMYYQSLDSNSRIVTMKATSTDGLVWPVENRSRFNLEPPGAPSNLPDGPYFIYTHLIGDQIYYLGWLPNIGGESGLWMIGPNRIWTLILPESLASPAFDASPLQNHVQGYFGSCLAEEDGVTHLFFHAVRAVGENNLASIFRTTVKDVWKQC